MKIYAKCYMGFLLVALIITLAGCASHKSEEATKTSIPSMATIGGVQIGYSTQEELARSWGDGLTVIGGHPNSGRVWRVRNTDWIIKTDGFEYSERGLVIDKFQIESQQGEKFGAQAPFPVLNYTNEDKLFVVLNSTNAPFAKLDKGAFAWLGEISRGMDKSEVIAALNRHSPKFKSQNDKLVLNADGFSPIASETNYDFHQWRAKLVFEKEKLSSLEISAEWK